MLKKLMARRVAALWYFSFNLPDYPNDLRVKSFIVLIYSTLYANEHYYILDNKRVVAV